MDEYIEYLEKTKAAFRTYGNLLKISAEDMDAEDDIFLGEAICSEEMTSILEIIDSLIERQILKQKLAIKG